MPYIGNDLATQFQAFATQTITGDGSTGYTLDRAVANGKELLVYINNVKQEEGSGKSYTASGTTITFSEAVASGDSCYLVYMGSAQQTVTPPAGSLGGYTGNASLDGAVTINESSADVDFRVESDVNANTLFVEGSTGNIGIGTSALSSFNTNRNNLVISDAASSVGLTLNSTGTDGSSIISMTDGTGTLAGEIHYVHDDDSMRFNTATSERMRILSGGGITFNGDTATANALDDYEEGTFTATMANSVTLQSGYDSLAYTKIGRQVTVTGQIQINNTNSNSHTVINNLPFTQFTQSSPNEDADRAFCAVRIYSHQMADDAQYVGAFTAEGTTNLYFVNVRDNAGTTDLESYANGYLMFTITYFTS